MGSHSSKEEIKVFRYSENLHAINGTKTEVMYKIHSFSNWLLSVFISHGHGCPAFMIPQPNQRLTLES